MRAAIAESWVVYRMPVRHCPDGLRAVCEQAEWDAMELANPGVNTLVRAGIPNEGEAERLARGTSGAAPRRGARRAVTAFPWEVAAAAAAAGATDPAGG